MIDAANGVNEVMVLFYCAFLALRSEDNKTPVNKITDFEVHKEKELFAGSVSTTAIHILDLTHTHPLNSPIVDDHYQHGLRLFQDRESGVIRLQASVQAGEFKR